MEPENLNIPLGKTKEERELYSKIKEENDKLRFKNLRDKYNDKFSEFLIFSFLSADSIEDAFIVQFLCNFRSSKGKNKRPVDIIFNENVKYIGVNVNETKKKLKGYLIFAY